MEKDTTRPMTGWIVFFTNPGKSMNGGRMRTPPFATKEEAQKSADFLKFQGAKRISIRWS